MLLERVYRPADLTQGQPQPVQPFFTICKREQFFFHAKVLFTGFRCSTSSKARDSYKARIAYHRHRLFLRGIFPPDPKWLVGSLLHGIGGLIVIFGSPTVFALVSKGFIRNETSATIARLLICTAALTRLSLALDLRVHRRFQWCDALR